MYPTYFHVEHISPLCSVVTSRVSQQSFTSPTGIAIVAPAGEDREQPERPAGVNEADDVPGVGEIIRGNADAGGTAEVNGRIDHVGGSRVTDGRVLTTEAAQQAFLSRLLLMLGSFVVLCLMIF